MDFIILGMALIMIGLSMLSLSTVNADVGGVILIGPIPIVFGTSTESAYSALFGALIIFLIFFALMRMRW
jgi:uncharacterized protein (TIGR00304 family)